jgi:hypothetical protein
MTGAKRRKGSGVDPLDYKTPDQPAKPPILWLAWIVLLGAALILLAMFLVPQGD